MVLAIPDPHIERWLLLDGAAFKAVFGTGCDAPDLKCERNHYKRQLMDAIQSAGTTPRLGGIEYAEEIVQHMNLDRVARLDRVFRSLCVGSAIHFQWLVDMSRGRHLPLH